MKTLLRLLLATGWVFAMAPCLKAEFITYTYDTAGRLTAVNYGSGKSTAYQYDPAGNLLKKSDTLLADSDDDGMDDAWEMTYFGTLARNGSGDFDSDGMSDLSEFLAGTLPNDSQSLLRISSKVTATAVSTSIEWSAVSGKTYRVQYKNALTDPGWNDLPGDVTAGGSTASKTDKTTPGQPKRFYRVQVVM